MTELLVRPATPLDLPAIAAIQAASPEAARWNPAQYLDYDTRVAIAQDQVVAFLVLRQTAPGEREILNLAVDPGHRRQGIGRRLLMEVLAGPGTGPRSDWFLEVRESNRAAVGLYRGLGFVPSGFRPAYYADPPESGIVMKRAS